MSDAAARPPFLLGVTGGIASGKSVMTAMLRERGAEVIDADLLAREVVAPATPALAGIGRRFPGVLTPEGALDRAALGARVFGDPAERRALEAIVHPAIQAAFEERTRALAAEQVPLIVYDAALLFENRIDERLDASLLVAAPPALQRQRLLERDGLTQEAADARIAAQMPLEEKRARATWTVENDGPLEQTRARIEALWRGPLREALESGGRVILEEPFLSAALRNGDIAR